MPDVYVSRDTEGFPVSLIGATVTVADSDEPDDETDLDES